MADSTTSIQAITPSPDTMAIQSAQAAAIANSAQVNEANNAAFLTEIVQAEVENNLLTSESNQATTPNDFSTVESLLSIDTPTLSLFNEIGTDPTSANMTGDLTMQQMQAIGVLQQDVQSLEEAANVSSHIPLASGATTVELSVGAQNIANGVSSSTTVPVNASSSLTPTQLGQIGTILAPLTHQPLTQSLLTQIQAQLTAAGISPLQLSLQTVFLVMNYMAGLLPASPDAMKATKIGNVESAHKVIVGPVLSIDRVAIEDSAILSE